MDPIDFPQFRHVSWRWIAYATSAFLIVAIAFAFFHEVELKQDVRAEIVSAAEIKIQGLDGLVSDVYVRPDTRVAQGAPLFVLERDLTLASDGRPRPVFDAGLRDEKIRAADAGYAQRSTELTAQLGAARVAAQSRRAELAALDEQLAQNGQLVSDTARKLTRLESVADYVSAERIDAARADTHQARAGAAQSVARRQQVLAELGAAQGSQAELVAQLGGLAVQHTRDVQEIRQNFERNRQNLTIAAPRAGVVTFSGLVAGRTLAPADVALVIATGNGPLRAALRIPSRRRGFVREGQIVRLKFDAFPYAKFGSYEAHIDSVSTTTVHSPISPRGASGPSATDSDFMAWATLRGHTFDVGQQHLDILPGMGATASIAIERRTIAQWVLAPLFRVLKG